MTPTVFKFGGSSLAGAERIRHVAELVVGESDPPVVVVSALAGSTDRLVGIERTLDEGGEPGPAHTELIEYHREVAADLAAGDADGLARLEGAITRAFAPIVRPELGSLETAERADRIRACGEDAAVPLLVYAIGRAQGSARAVDARAIVRTDDRFGRAIPDETAMAILAAAELVPVLADDTVPVVQGFVGSTADGRTTTLGRGGSDYSASLIAAALRARSVDLWTDVDGVFSGDPRAVPETRALARLGFEEAVELAYFGARVLHPAAAKHAVSRGLEVRIRSTFAPERPGTLILRDRRGPAEIAAVAFKPGVALIQVRSRPDAMPFGFLARVFEILARHRLPVDLVATSHTSTAFTLDASEEISEAAEELEDLAEVEVHTGLATVTVVGHGLLREPGVNARVFDAVGRTPVHLISQATDVSLSFVVAEVEAPELVRRLHRALIEPHESVPEATS